ncbi:hypothetical protein [Haloarchaeobius sp. DFWS5]|uniref:hypothetical protein n=1 Tax=Haloarchaeobius sp. DFWS5 TaxID=3446114 RepID=UPI003EB9418E
MSDPLEQLLGGIDPTTVGRGFAVVDALVGLVFVASPLYLLTDADPSAAGIVQVVHGIAVVFGLSLLALSWVGRHGARPLATMGPALFGVLLLVLGPVLDYVPGQLSWAGLALAGVFAVTVPALWVAYRDRPAE